MKNLKLLYTTILISFALVTNAQESTNEIYEMSLEDLMQIEIYSVSKKAESLFDAPLSSSTVTREEIINSGATGIPEALRLVPGLIVREQENGVYDVHLRGLDNVTRYGSGQESTNQITLVMIDGRPVFNNNLGGVYWEAIPVDLIDVERIEVVRGPSSPLYGPNAANGVINIITRNIDTDGLNISANANGGANGTYTGGLNLGYKFNDKLAIAVSGNFQQRDRFDDQYLEYAAGQYKSASDLRGTVFGQSSPIIDPDNTINGQSLRKTGVNLFIDYTIAEDFAIGLETGIQNAEIQKIYLKNNWTPFSGSKYDSKYANLTFNRKGLTGRFSYVNGFDNINSLTDAAISKYDWETVDAMVEYNWDINEKLSIRPGISYQKATYNDQPYLEESSFGLLNERRTIRSLAASLATDYHVTDKWRVIAAGRMDQFTTPDDIYLSYQLASTYNINDKNLIRVAFAKSNSGSFIGPNFLDINPASTGNPAVQINYNGNQNMTLFRNHLIELGYRSKLADNLEINVELFRQWGKDFNALVEDAAVAPAIQAVSQVFFYTNLSEKVVQNGLTLSANYVPSTKFQIKPFVTFQKTTVENLPTRLTTAGLDPAANINILQDVDNDQTPSAYGGLYFNYKPTKKLNINLNPYFTSAQTQYSFYSLANPAFSGDVDGKIIINAKVSYDITDNFNVYVTGRNLFADDAIEYAGASRLSSTLLAGLRYKL